MEAKVYKEILEVIKTEEKRRVSTLPDHRDAADHLWTFRHEPLLNELCLMLLVTLRHHVERVLIGFAARSLDGGRPISREAYEAHIRELLNFDKGRSSDRTWKEIKRRLNIDSSSPKATCLKGLRLLANSYKHDPFGEPSDELKKFLGRPEVNFEPLPRGYLVREELAKLVGLDKDASYPEIVEGYLTSVNEYLSDLESRNGLSEIEPFPAPIKPEESLLY
jgi:hypothetical protein